MRALWVVLLLAGAARAEDDFSPAATGWNGLSQLSADAASLGCPLEVRDAVDWSQLDARDVLWFVYPRSTVEPDKLRAWLAAGGSAVIADDFGAASSAFASLSMTRVAAPASAERYDDRPALPIARPSLLSALGRSAPMLVANHPAALSTSLPATYAFSPQSALVVEGHLGKGSFVALADPSVLINNMLEIDENRAFARELIRGSCAAAGRGARILMLTGGFVSRGNPPKILPGEAAARGAPGLGPDLARAAADANLAIERVLGDKTVRAVLGLFFALLTGALLLRLFPLPRHLGDRFLRAGSGHAAPLLVGALDDYGAAAVILRDEVQSRVEALLGQSVPVGERDARRAVGALAARLGPGAGAAADELLADLARIRWRRIHGETIADQPVPRARLVTLHRLASTLFAAIERV